MTRRDTLICCLCALGVGLLAWVNRDAAGRLARIDRELAEMQLELDQIQQGQERLSQWDKPLLPEVGIEAAPAPEREALGEFTVYAYCPCRACCGKWADGFTASGTEAAEGRTIAADWSVLPAGTAVYIEGIGEFVVEDTGVTGNTLDIFFADHKAALAFGKQTVRVWRLTSPAP